MRSSLPEEDGLKVVMEPEMLQLNAIAIIACDKTLASFARGFVESTHLERRMNRIHLIDTKYEPQEGKETIRDPWNSIITPQAPTGYNGMLAQLKCPFQHICSKITTRFASERRGGKININE